MKVSKILATINPRKEAVKLDLEGFLLLLSHSYKPTQRKVLTEWFFNNHYLMEQWLETTDERLKKAGMALFVMDGVFGADTSKCMLTQDSFVYLGGVVKDAEQNGSDGGEKSKIYKSRLEICEQLLSSEFLNKTQRDSVRDKAKFLHKNLLKKRTLDWLWFRCTTGTRHLVNKGMACVFGIGDTLQSRVEQLTSPETAEYILGRLTAAAVSGATQVANATVDRMAEQFRAGLAGPAGLNASSSSLAKDVAPLLMQDVMQENPMPKVQEVVPGTWIPKEPGKVGSAQYLPRPRR